MQDAGAPGREWNSLDLVEESSTVFTFVNSGAGAQIDVHCVARIDDDREDIRVVYDAIFHSRPALASVYCLPGQVPGSGGILRIDGERLDVLDLGIILRRDTLPGVASITTAEYALERADNESLGI